jgi:hypothetical protein
VNTYSGKVASNLAPWRRSRSGENFGSGQLAEREGLKSNILHLRKARLDRGGLSPKIKAPGALING